MGHRWLMVLGFLAGCGGSPDECSCSLDFEKVACGTSICVGDDRFECVSHNREIYAVAGCHACTPNCRGRECGSDGCGGSCGSCARYPDPATSCSDDGREVIHGSALYCLSNGLCGYRIASHQLCEHGCDQGTCTL